MGKTFSKVTAIHEMSREAFKNMPKARRIEDKRRKPPKHRKQDWED